MNKKRIAGVDCGSSLLKVAYIRKRSRSYTFLSTQLMSADEIWQRLQDDDVGVLQCIGIGRHQIPVFFEVKRPKGDPILAEVRMQTFGALSLLPPTQLNRAKSALLYCSIGTGTSYTLSSESQMLLGSAMGGGTVAGLARIFGISMHEVLTKAPEGTVLDLFVRDLVPESGSIREELRAVPIAHFAKAQMTHNLASDLSASLLHMLATCVARDVLLHCNTGSCKQVVFTGTLIEESVYLQELLRTSLTSVGFRVYVPPHAGFAGAVGAYETSLEM